LSLNLLLAVTVIHIYVHELMWRFGVGLAVTVLVVSTTLLYVESG